MSEKCTLLHKSHVPSAVVELANELLLVKEAKDRQTICYKMLKLLASHFDVCNCRLKIYDEQRPLTDEKTTLFGQYCNRPSEKPLIEIWNFTRTGRRVSSISILYTFLHEFIHHYDARYLCISPKHGFGFHARLRFLVSIFKQQKDFGSKKINK